MKISFVKNDDRNPALLEYKKPKHTGEIIFAVISILIMLFPLFVDMGHPAPIISTEIIGFLFLVTAVAVFADSEIGYRKAQKAISMGVKYKALITDIHHKIKSTRRSGDHHRIHLYCTECEFTDPKTNEKYLLTSRYVRYNLNGTVGRTVDVYFDPDDRTNYFVDLTTILDEEE